MTAGARSAAVSPGDRNAPRSPATALLRRWPLAVVLAVAGAGAGAAYASTATPTYTAEARVAVGYGDLNAGAITGFPTSAESLASNYARYVRDQGLTGEGLAAVPAGVALSATPIPDSNVIRIIAQSTSDDDAVGAVQQTAEQLVEAVNNPSGASSPAQLKEQFNTAALASAEAGSARDQADAAYGQAQAAEGTSARRIEALRQALVTATAAAAEADLDKSAAQSQYLQAVSASRSADLLVVANGAITDDDRSSRLQRYGLIGGVLGLALALVVATALERRGAGRRGDDRAHESHASDGPPPAEV